MDELIDEWMDRWMNGWVSGNTHSRELVSSWVQHCGVNNGRSFQSKEALETLGDLFLHNICPCSGFSTPALETMETDLTTAQREHLSSGCSFQNCSPRHQSLQIKGTVPSKLKGSKAAQEKAESNYPMAVFPQKKHGFGDRESREPRAQPSLPRPQRLEPTICWLQKSAHRQP